MRVPPYPKPVWHPRNPAMVGIVLGCISLLTFMMGFGFMFLTVLGLLVSIFLWTISVTCGLCGVACAVGAFAQRRWLPAAISIVLSLAGLAFSGAFVLPMLGNLWKLAYET